MNRGWILALVAIAAAVAIYFVTSGGNDDVDEPAAVSDVVDDDSTDSPVAPEEEDEERAVPLERPPGFDEVDAGSVDAGIPDVRERPELVNMYDEEEERQARERVTREYFGEDGPETCESVCDCPAGAGCQTPPGICIPGLLDVPCCTHEEGCEEGASCLNADGTQGTCPTEE